MNSQKELIGPVNKSKTETEQLIFFLHGWGSDGNDLIQISNLWEKEINKTFHIKSLKQKAAIVFAGPLANFIFAFLIFLLLFLVKGAPSDIKYYPIIDLSLIHI